MVRIGGGGWVMSTEEERTKETGEEDRMRSKYDGEGRVVVFGRAGAAARIDRIRQVGKAGW